MLRIYMDTNVIDKFLGNNPQQLLLFHSLKKRQCVQFLCSIDLLMELSNNPDAEKAKLSLKIINKLCSLHLFTREPKVLFQDEFDSFFAGKERNPFLSRSEAKDMFEHVFWDNLTNGKLGEIQSWVKEHNKQRFAEERNEFEKEKKIKQDIPISQDVTFEAILNAAKCTGDADRYMINMVIRQCQKEPSQEMIAAILCHLGELPVIRCCFFHYLAYLHFFYIKGKRPAKHGNNIDARHIMAAANADIFITDDGDLLNLIKSADGRWPFMPMTAEHFCQKFGGASVSNSLENIGEG